MGLVVVTNSYSAVLVYGRGVVVAWESCIVVVVLLGFLDELLFIRGRRCVNRVRVSTVDCRVYF